jgi:hypothetical protein
MIGIMFLTALNHKNLCCISKDERSDLDNHWYKLGNISRQHSEVEFWQKCPKNLEHAKLKNTITDQKDVGYAKTFS